MDGYKRGCPYGYLPKAVTYSSGDSDLYIGRTCDPLETKVTPKLSHECSDYNHSNDTFGSENLISEAPVKRTRNEPKLPSLESSVTCTYEIRISGRTHYGEQNCRRRRIIGDGGPPTFAALCL